MPEGWREVELGEIAETSKTRWSPGDEESALGSYIALEHIEPDRRRIEARGEIETVESQKTAFGEGDVLFGKLRPYLRKVAQSDFEGVCSTDVLVYRTRNPKFLHEDYLYYLLSRDATIQYSVANSSGTRMPRISEKRLSEMKVLLPPLVEQRRIADLLTHTDKAIELGLAEQDRLSKLRISLISELFRPEDAESEDLVNCKLEDVLEVVVGGTPKTGDPGNWDGSILWVTPSDITSSSGVFLSETDRMISEQGLASSSATLVRAGSTLVSTRATIGPAVLASTDLATNQGVTALTPRSSDVISDRWLFYWVQAHGREFKSRGAGNTFKEVARSRTRAIPISYPPFDEQTQVADTLTLVDDALAAQRAANEQLTKVRTSLVSALLSGEHEIPESYDRFLEEAA